MAETTGTGVSITEKLAAGVPDRNVGLAYGEKQTINGVDIVPVAFVAYGFGGGESDELGSGGGGGGTAIPLGVYVGGPSGPRFRANTLALLAVSVPVISTIGYVITKIVKAARH